MKKMIILSAVFIVMMAAAVVGYQVLSSDYNMEAIEHKGETTDEKETETDDRDTDDQNTDDQDTEKDEPEESINVPVVGTVLAADFTVEDWESVQVNLSDYYGKPVIVNFWATWCGPCKLELPAFDNAYAAYQDEITFLMVNMTDGYSETVDGTKQFIEENGYSFPVYFDTSYEAYQAYGVTAIPMTLFIDADGNLINYELGAMSESTLIGYLQEYYGVE
ncbi:MAG: TlpA family protein disulfide reductase [Lachnospiraceae bacterium]|nr:TlpA family protein disulfide reductase [Lachnospiraceae bacterium]